MTPDLHRIARAIGECRERYQVTRLPDEEIWRLIDSRDESTVVTGYCERCLEVLDTRCAEVAVRAMREPGEAAVDAGGKIIFDGEYDLDDFGEEAAR